MKEETKAVVCTSSREERFREGRGFSLGEIGRAGLTLNEMKTLGLPIDKRRRTTHIKNVRMLKEHIGTPIPLSEIGGIGRVTAQKLERAGILDAYDLAHVDINSLANRVSYSKKTVKKWQSDAKKLQKKQQA